MLMFLKRIIFSFNSADCTNYHQRDEVDHKEEQANDLISYHMRLLMTIYSANGKQYSLVWKTRLIASSLRFNELSLECGETELSPRSRKPGAIHRKL